MAQHSSVRIVGTLVGLVISIFLLGGGYVAVQQFTRASDAVPREVLVTSLTSTTAKVEWSTGTETQGVVEYGTSPTTLNFFAPESQKGTQHSVDLTLLSPNTTYYFQIKIGDGKFDNGGVPWTFTTKITDDQGSSDAKPSPIQRLKIPDGTGDVTAPQTCDETDCNRIRAKFGKGCSVEDYVKCLKKK